MAPANSRPTQRPYRSKRAESNYIANPNGSSSPNLSTVNIDAYIDDVHFPSNNEVVNRPSGSRPKRRRKGRSTIHLDRDPLASIGKPIPTTASLLSPPYFCDLCGAKKFEHEPPSFCCSKGEVKVATNPYDPELMRLFTSRDSDSMHFQKYSRLYNNLFAFSSLGGSIDCSTQKGIYAFRLHGQIYHFLPNLVPHENTPKYLQLYFYDGEHEQENRAGLFSELSTDMIACLMNVMKQNPYAQFFSSLREKHVDETTTIRINKNPTLDQRVYNAPTSQEVAALWLDSSDSSDSTGPYIVVSGKGGTSHRIMHYYGCYDPLQYPLLFPRGDNGWRPGLKRIRQTQQQNFEDYRLPVLSAATAETLIEQESSLAIAGIRSSSKDISCREYYAFMFQIRDNTYLLHTRRLLQQFVVDMYVKLENSRLDFFRNNQGPIRADLYQGLVDTSELGEDNGANVGRRIILPPSFIGGPRDMRRRYLNAMALVQRFGKPDLFCTMTCNPNWQEIKQELADGEQAQDRPDLVSRVFRAKLITARKKIVDEEIFGKVAAYIYVVEFQKRGLPHAHFLIILKPPYKIKGVEDFDKFVSAEIPPTTNPHLRKAVLNHMMHGPCGLANPTCPCMREQQGKKGCKFSYPKDFQSQTSSNSNGYPLYRRAFTGETVTVRRAPMDNRWVIPYNPYLLAFFDCHLNVEVCSTIQAVKYLYKYVYKGHDRVSFNICEQNRTEPVDEIENFQSGRWVSPPEAAWRIFGFDLYEMHPPVLPLQVHLPNMQTIHFRPRERVSSIIADESRSRTQLTEFFKINEERPDGEKLLYSEFPEHFVWDNKSKTWTQRKRGFVVGRVTFVNPSEPHRFHLRILLTHVRGPKSFDDLLTVDGHRCSTFQEAAIKRGLVEPTESIEMCMDEAVEFQMPYALRRLFVTLLIFCQPANPSSMWDKYYTALSEDFRNSHSGKENEILSLTIQSIEQMLESMGRNLHEFNLEHLQKFTPEISRVVRDIQDVIDAPVPEAYIQARKQLNVKQREAYKSIISHVKANKPSLFFIDGPGGTGKTFLYCALYAKLRLMEKIVLPTASSGIAASNLPSGRTAHSRFKLPIDHEGSLTCNVAKQGGLASLLRETSVIIWDEAPMANKASLHALDLLLQDLVGKTSPFGGKIIVLGGDFRQVLPVVPHKSQHDAVNASLVSSPLWPLFNRFHLTENMRAREDPAFASFLLALGDGKLQCHANDIVNLPSNLVVAVDDNTDSIQQLIEEVYLEDGQFPSNPELFINKAILAPRNEDVDQVNDVFIGAFSGNTVSYKGFDTLLDDNCNIYPLEFLHTLCPGGMSPYDLVLKQNCPVILLRNLDPSAGLCNGTRLICKEFQPNLILCEIATGWYKGQKTLIPRINLRPSSTSNYPFQFQRTQFPLKLSFAMTINKAQGQTLSDVGIYLRQPCFSHGQLYVALSRAKHASKVKVISASAPSTLPVTSVRNIVSYEVLNRAGII